MAIEEVPFTEARASLADLVGRVAYGGARVVLTRHGKPAAALVPVADLERLEAADAGEGAHELVQLRQGSFDGPPVTGPRSPGHMGIAASHSGQSAQPPGR